MKRWSTGFTVLACAAVVVAVLNVSSNPMWYVLEAVTMVGCMILLSDKHIDQDHAKWN